MPRIASRIAAITPSATLVVDSKAKALKADGQPVIGFGAGEPDFPTPAHIVEAARQALNDPKNFRYSPSAGLPELKQAIAEKTLRDSGVQVDPSQVLVTNGGKQAVYEAFATVIDTGDDVLLPAPYWTTYPECIRLAGGNPIEVFAGSEQDYKVTVEQLEAAYTPATKALLFVSPSNPTGWSTPRKRRALSGSGRSRRGFLCSPTKSMSTSPTTVLIRSLFSRWFRSSPRTASSSMVWRKRTP